VGATRGNDGDLEGRRGEGGWGGVDGGWCVGACGGVLGRSAVIEANQGGIGPDQGRFWSLCREDGRWD
jgi:hypothetical protein